MRNLSFKTDDNFDDRLYSESKKRGITKSALIKQELEKVLNIGINNVDMVKEKIEKKNYVDNIVSSIDLTKVDINDDKFESRLSQENTSVEIKHEPKFKIKSGSIPEVPKEEQKPEPKESTLITSFSAPLIKEEQKSEISTSNAKIDPKSQITPPMDLERLKNLDLKIQNPEKKELSHKIENLINLNIDKIKNESKPTKYKVTERRRMNDEEQHTPVLTEEQMERYLNKHLSKQKFDENFRDMHANIKSINDRVCKDGDCTQRELSEIKKNLGNFEIIKGDISKLKNDLTVDLSKLKEMDTLKNDLNEIKGKFKKTEICPGCGHPEVQHLSSYCPECGIELKGWEDDSGKPVPGWKHHKERFPK